MITSRRDYIMRLIEEVAQLLRRTITKRQDGDDRTALETVVFGFSRLFNLDANQVFQFTPEQHFAMLCNEENPDDCRDKVLLYAALSTEAGRLYAKMGNRAMARATYLNALRFVLKARAQFSPEGMPDYAPKVEDLLAALGPEPLDAETAALLKSVIAG